MNKLIGLGISAFLVFLLLFGCTQPSVSGDDSNDYNGLANVNNNLGQENLGNNNGSNTGNALSEFSNLVAKSANLSYMVKMDLSSGSTSQSMTKYVSGSNVRFDAEAEGAVSRIYYISSGNYVCFFNEKWICMASPSTSDEYQPYEYDKKLIDDSQKGAALTKIESKTILGMQTECFAITPTVGGRNAFCLNQNGVMLYIESTSEGALVKYTAIEYAENVKGDAFTLPGEVMSFQ